MLELIDPRHVFAAWPDARKQLRRTAKYDPNFDENEVLTGIINQTFHLWRTEAGFIVTGIRKRKGEAGRIFRIFYTAGSILGANKAPFSYVRQIMRKLEETALTGEFEGVTAPKCKQVRLEGRKGWAKLLPEYSKRQLNNGNFEFYRGL
ncbi:hypothetical protein JY97_00695 [Alkalispirochaeta odontotermitis]|nr:hypothetical protein JY97_00695 [Alkalispirochaeta odontotermitis]